MSTGEAPRRDRRGTANFCSEKTQTPYWFNREVPLHPESKVRLSLTWQNPWQNPWIKTEHRTLEGALAPLVLPSVLRHDLRW
jgi:hypothetical protein